MDCIFQCCQEIITIFWTLSLLILDSILSCGPSNYRTRGIPAKARGLRCHGGRGSLNPSRCLIITQVSPSPGAPVALGTTRAGHARPGSQKGGPRHPAQAWRRPRRPCIAAAMGPLAKTVIINDNTRDYTAARPPRPATPGLVCWGRLAERQAGRRAWRGRGAAVGGEWPGGGRDDPPRCWPGAVPQDRDVLPRGRYWP